MRLVWVYLNVYLDNARYTEGILYLTEMVNDRSPRSQLGVNIQCLARYTTAKPLRTAPNRFMSCTCLVATCVPSHNTV